MLVDGGFVGEDDVFVGAVGDAHDVDVVEFGAAFAPVGVGHDVDAADFPAGLDFAAGRDGPVEKGVEFGDALAVGERFDVFEEGGESADDAAAVELVGDVEERFQRHAGFGARGLPEFGDDFFGVEFALQGDQHPPFQVAQFDDLGVHAPRPAHRLCCRAPCRAGGRGRRPGRRAVWRA